MSVINNNNKNIIIIIIIIIITIMGNTVSFQSTFTTAGQLLKFFTTLFCNF